MTKHSDSLTGLPTFELTCIVGNWRPNDNQSLLEIRRHGLLLANKKTDLKISIQSNIWHYFCPNTAICTPFFANSFIHYLVDGNIIIDTLLYGG